MRKTLLLFACALLISAGFSPVMAGSGGPDSYGYTWIDSDEPNGPSFNWVDITGRMDAVQISGLADDNAVGPFAIGFNFHYYWSDYNSVKVGSNGWISFNNVGNVASCFPTIPTAGGAGDNLICPYMSDLTFVSNSTANPNIGEMWYWTNGVDSFIIQYVNVPWWQSGTPDWIGSNTFELILNAQDSSITLQYLNTDGANLQTNPCPTVMEIGMENLTGNIGLPISSGTTVPNDSLAIRISYPPVVTFQVKDATPAWSANAENAGQFVYTGTSTSLETNIASVGNTDITAVINIAGTIDQFSGPTGVWTDNTSITGLNVGQNQTVPFNTPAVLNTAGQYTFKVDISSSDDINPSNNTNRVEIAAVDNNGGSVKLTYCTGNPPDGALSWAGGGIDDGVAVKMIPPSYPLDIASVNVWIAGDGDINTPLGSGYSLVIYGEDGNGNVDLGNVLQVEDRIVGNILEDNWNTVTLDTSVLVTSGAFFVAWLQGGSGIAIGSEAAGPISRRSYEILGGSWSPYRQNTVDDFLIEVNGSVPVSIDPASGVKLQVASYPNPVRDLATIAYGVVESGDVRFSLSNVTGQQVWTKTHAGVSPGDYKFNIDASDLGSGVYFLSMEQNGRNTVTKMVIQ